jgi:pimeloyl-ACP methyl ester carboxylesterase
LSWLWQAEVTQSGRSEETRTKVTTVHHRYTAVGGQSLFYREAGPLGAPAVVLLHGSPTSSFMFRLLMPFSADQYHVVAPDFLGFGVSDAPPVADFDYSFDTLADLTGELVAQLGLERFAMYVQDYGAPVGWRLALRNPKAVLAIITQNGNAYEEGFELDATTERVRRFLERTVV